MDIFFLNYLLFGAQMKFSGIQAKANDMNKLVSYYIKEKRPQYGGLLLLNRLQNFIILKTNPVE
jgi:hypothetical protein